MAQYTNGPWETNGLVIETVSTPAIVIGRAYDERDSGGGIDSDSIAEANARLIAAAPDLLEACRAAVEFLRDEMPFAAENVLENAIAKAEGR